MGLAILPQRLCGTQHLLNPVMRHSHPRSDLPASEPFVLPQANGLLLLRVQRVLMRDKVHRDFAGSDSGRRAGEFGDDGGEEVRGGGAGGREDGFKGSHVAAMFSEAAGGCQWDL